MLVLVGLLVVLLLLVLSVRSRCMGTRLEHLFMRRVYRESNRIELCIERKE